jgi:hypothetical protein
LGYELAQTLPADAGVNEVDLSRFTYGPAFAVRFRYKLRGPAAIGVSFEEQEFQFDGVRSAEDPKKLHLDIVSAEMFRYFSREEPRTRYVVGGISVLTKVEGRGEDQSMFEPHQGFGLVVGGGTEMFRGRHNNGLDLSVRVYPFVVAGRYGATGILALGINHYMQP